LKHSPLHSVIDLEKSIFTSLWPETNLPSTHEEENRKVDSEVVEIENGRIVPPPGLSLDHMLDRHRQGVLLNTEVHVMMVPWANKPLTAPAASTATTSASGYDDEEGHSGRTRFKLTGLHSC
jgi:hypothetical protein